MPGGDRTGPMGSGPMTGRRAGFCAGYSIPGYSNPVSGRGFFGYGRGGYGRGRGLGRGFFGGFGFRRAAVPYPAADPGYSGEMTPDQEAELLKAEVEAMNRRIKDLEASGSSGKVRLCITSGSTV